MEMLTYAKNPQDAIEPWLESLQVWGSYCERNDRVRQLTPRANSIRKLDAVCSELSTISGEISASPIASEIYGQLVLLERSFRTISQSIEPENDE